MGQVKGAAFRLAAGDIISLPKNIIVIRLYEHQYYRIYKCVKGLDSSRTNTPRGIVISKTS
jgi:hypothetical protein